ncbi:MAG TPA: ATP-binding cassette domain-containing protein [Actinomycetota bacterium]|nr:ATP-binding cassette domain-containing protein [Actinomycetota bacterium]
MSALVEVEALRKVYPDGTEAVRGIDFAVAEGEFFGFLGPNGAGKSTTIKMLVTLLPPTDGRAMVAGHTLGRDDRRIREVIGYAAQDVSVDEDLTGRENLILSGRLYHLSHRAAERRADELLELIGLTDAAHKRAGFYSGGMRRRLDLAQALMHMPKLLFLDEPTTGLDPQNRRAMWNEISKLNREGTTIFLTTQYMEEADTLCKRLAVIDHGMIVSEGSPAALKAELGGEVLTLSFPTDDPEKLASLIARSAEILRGIEGLAEVREADRTVMANIKTGSKDVLPQALRAIEDAALDARIAVSPPTLDDVFMKITGHALREEEGKPTGFSFRRRGRS